MGSAETLRHLFTRLVAYKVLAWQGTSADGDMSTDRVQADLEQADVASSQLLGTDRHVIALDIDHPTWLVKSSSPNKYHLYVDIPGGIEWDRYAALLEALSLARVIETGYANVSIERKATMLRLPWVTKDPADIQSMPAPQPVPVSGNSDPWDDL